MATQSRFISLTPYCLVEYMAEPLGSSNYMTEDFVLLKNDKLNIFQIYNNDSSYNTTRNIKDLTVVPTGENQAIYLDSEKVPNYTDYNEDLVESDVNGFNVVFDRVRFHFITGFDFEGFEALILSIRNRQNDGNQHIFANIILAPETIGELITFNPKPLFLSDTTYDRYIDVKIPSIKNINEEYTIAPVQENTFAANITPKENGSIGFITNAPISVNLSECSRRTKLSTDVGVKYDSFEISENYDGSISQTNEFDAVGASIGESDNGDFIEYYLTYNSGFPEEMISILNRRNPADDWIIIHQLSIYEQVGSSFINTSRQVIFQEDGWDEPLVFRPVLKNAGSAVSMSIDLLCRLTNKRNGEQIIREASFTMLSPKKYGKKLITIPLSDEPQSQKVYNKITKKNFEATKLFIQPEFQERIQENSGETQVITTTEYVPVFTSNNNISVANNSGYLKVNDKADEIIFGPGRLRFIISPFDNAIKLKMYNIVNKKPIPLDLNLNGAKYNLVFETSEGNISIGNINSDKFENLSQGILLFEISKKQSQDIYKSNKQTIYITSISQDGKETLMYSGEWRKSTEQSDIDAAVEKAKSESEEVQARESKISELEAKIEELKKEQDTVKFNFGENAIVKKVATPSVVNRIGMASPKKVKTNVSNAGRAQTTAISTTGSLASVSRNIQTSGRSSLI